MEILNHHLPEALSKFGYIMDWDKYKVSRFCHPWQNRHFQHPVGRLSNHILPHKLSRGNGNCVLKDHQKIGNRAQNLW